MIEYLRRIALCLALLVITLIASVAYAQDLSNVRVDDLSDAQVRQFLQQAQSTGMSEEQLEQMAAARGMSSSEVSKLRARVDKMNSNEPDSKRLDNLNRSGRTYKGNQQDSISNGNDAEMASQDALLEDALKQLKPKVFGHELFQNAKPQFEPNLQIATPKSYVVGPGDELLIDVYGDSEVSYQLTVTPDGKINLPYVGVISVSGSSIDQVSSRIRNQLANVYSGLSSGRTKVDISLGNIRSIQVVLAGEVIQPGTYTLPSVSSVFNALYAAGGPRESGSVRDIKVYRKNRIIAELDVYDFLLNGSLAGNINLQDQDIVQIGVANNRVFVSGEVRRPMYFDAKAGETFADLLQYAGGFTSEAYTARVSVERQTKRERRVEDVLESHFPTLIIQSGDRFHVGKTLDRFENRIRIVGAVFNPGVYELTTGLTLSILIKKADGIREDAYTNLGYIDRIKDNMESERLNFNIAEILAGTQPDIQLQREDVVHIASLFDLRNAWTVRVEGEVRNPGEYPFAQGMQVQDLLLQAGGFKETASRSRIEVSRRVRDADPLDQSATVAKVFHIDLPNDLEHIDSALALEPFDFITVRSQLGYEAQKNIRIEGEIMYPGIYTIQSKNERISDLISRAGGITAFAYPRGASLKRLGVGGRGVVKSSQDQSESEKFEIEQLQEQQQSREEEIEGLDVVNVASEQASKVASLSQSINNDYVGVRLDRIIANESERDNILVQDGDVIYIPRLLQTVRVNGEVLSPVNTVYREGASFSDYISQAGGYTNRALRKRAYVVYANGSARSTKSFLGIKNYPKIEPGAEIFIPQKPQRERLSPQAWVGLGSGVASMAAIIVSLIRR